MSTITEKLGLDGDTRELKLGKSFQNFRPSSSSSRDNHDRSSSQAFHSIRYDFKPASIDTSKMAGIEFGENNKVTVTMPNVESSGLPHTVFKGSRKPHLKECVLIIDHETGELTLERLASNITVKKARAEGSSRAGMPRPITPSIESKEGNGHNSKKSSPTLSSASGHNVRSTSPKTSLSVPSSNSHLLYTDYSHQNSSPSAPGSKSAKSSPSLPPIGSHRSPYVQINSSSLSQPANFGLSSSTGHPNKESTKMDDDMIGILSESSSDSSENDSSGSDNSDSSSDEEEKKVFPKNGIKSRKSDSSSKGESSSSGSESGSDSGNEQDTKDFNGSQANNKARKPTSTGGSSVPPSVPNMLSMPKFSQLSEDLQLSESGSDSD